MSETIRILTPEQVELDYEVAGLGSRLLAGLIDGLIQIALLLAGYLVVFISAGSTLLGIGTMHSFTRFIFYGILALWILYFFVIVWGYFIFFEVRWNGQTPGKRALGLRVIRESGHPLDLRAALLRNLVRVVDMLPGIYAVAIVTMFVSSHWKRLGDHAAGTIVVKERRNLEMTPMQSAASWEPKGFTILNDQALSRISTLTREEYEIIRRFLERRDELDLYTVIRLAREIAHPLLLRLGNNFSLKISHDSDYEKFLEEVARAYEGTRGR